MCSRVDLSDYNMSAVWKWFRVSEEDSNYAICNTCKDEVEREEKTDLIRHLKQPAELAEFGEASKGQHNRKELIQ